VHLVGLGNFEYEIDRVAAVAHMTCTCAVTKLLPQAIPTSTIPVITNIWQNGLVRLTHFLGPRTYEFLSIELNIHQRILSDIASNVGRAGEQDVKLAQNLVVPVKASDIMVTEEEGNEKQRVFMVRRERPCQHSSPNRMGFYSVCIESALQHCIWGTGCQFS
jgi:hypothetical protein